MGSLALRSRSARGQELERFSALALRLRLVQAQQPGLSQVLRQPQQQTHSPMPSSSLCHHSKSINLLQEQVAQPQVAQ